jgi:hypothetical protein
MRPNVLIAIVLAVLWASAIYYLVHTRNELANTARETVSQNNDFRAVVTLDEPVFEMSSETQCLNNVDELPDVPSLFNRDDARLRRGLAIVVLKSKRRLMLMRNGIVERETDGAQMCFRIALGVNKNRRPSYAGDKSLQGDRRTPEGWFRTSDKPWSSYKNAILIHYPSDRHAALGLSQGLITRETHGNIVDANSRGIAPPQNTDLGGEILIHGLGSSSDWTWGCIALDDVDLAKLRSALPQGMRAWILILP